MCDRRQLGYKETYEVYIGLNRSSYISVEVITLTDFVSKGVQSVHYSFILDSFTVEAQL